jgi:pyruvate dehydrogenase E1 component
MSKEKIEILSEIEKKILWLSSWTIHNANQNRSVEETDVKVGGHQASSASIATIMTALYYDILKPEDRVAVKPHASPIFHAIQYLAGNQSQEKLENFRGYKGAQSYPSRTKDIDDVDFSTGSVGLGVAQTLFSSLVQDYVKAQGWMKDLPAGRMISLIGDAEMDEGNIYEALIEGWKHDIRNCWWIVDYNRQSLDAIIREGLWQKFEQMFENFGWDVVILRHGKLQEAAFQEPGGDKLRDWIEQCSNQLFSVLTFKGGSAWRQAILDDLGDQGDVSALIDRRTDDDLEELMGNLGGHDLPSLIEKFNEASKHDRPTLFVCYTIKGKGLPLAGHKDNHAGIMTSTQMDTLQSNMRIREGHEWDKWEGMMHEPATLQSFVNNSEFFKAGTRRYTSASIPVPQKLPYPAAGRKPISTQMGFGQILNELARDDSELASRIITTSPDVTVSTNLGGWVNRRGLFAKESVADTFKTENIPSTFNWTYSPKGQHLELGIAESNLFLMLSALGLSHSINGERLLPIGTVYDPFIYRAADQLNYACYQDARFMLVATPSGITLAPEGGAHQSIGTPLVGMAQDGLASFEPGFIDELAVIMQFGFEYMQRDGEVEIENQTWQRDQSGGSVYLRLSTRPLEQPQRDMSEALQNDIIEGAYWMREPGPNAEIIVAYTGSVAPEAIEAVGRMGEYRRDIGLLAITSADRLNAGWTAANHTRETSNVYIQSHIEKLLEKLPKNCSIITVIDGHPTTLAWLGSVHGHRTRSLGVEHFGQTGTIKDLYKHYGIDVNAIIRAAESLTPGKPILNKYSL